MQIDFQDHDKQLFAEELQLSPRWAICLFAAGSGSLQLGSGWAEVKPGMIVLIPPKTPHRWSASSRASHGTDVTCLRVSFDAKYLSNSLRNLPEAERLKALLEKSDGGICGRLNDPSRFVSRMRSLGRAKGMLRVARLYVLLDLMAQDVAWEKPSKVLEGRELKAGPAAKVLAVREFVETSLSRSILREEVARFVGMDPNAFSRFFRQATGMRFVDYVATMRVQAAARLLAGNRSLSVGEVGRSCGFRNQSAFNLQFKKRLGTTPREYRKNVNREPTIP